MADRQQARPIIVRRFEDATEHGHHGGAWKVAYADFMTAMMAFFLLMWIVSSATKDQLNGISEYFTPAKVSMTAKGGLGALGGTTFGPKGTLSQSNGVSAPKGMQTQSPKPEEAQIHPLPQMTRKDAPAAAADPARHPAIVPVKDGTAKDAAAQDGAAKNGSAVTTVIKTVDSHAADDAHFKEVQRELLQAMRATPDLKPLLKNVMFEKTRDGLNIQIVDQDKKPMFASGSAKAEGATRVLMQRLGKLIAGLPNKIRIAGHTDAVPYAEGAQHDNWELSSERANATRRVFLSVGVAPGHVERISGVADTDPLIPANPRDPRNRRITVTLAYQHTGSAQDEQAASAAPPVAASPHAAEGAAPQQQAAPASGSTSDGAGSAEKTAAAEPSVPAALARTYSLVSLNDLRRAAD